MTLVKEGTTPPVQIGDPLTNIVTGATEYFVAPDEPDHVWVTTDQTLTTDSPTYIRPIAIVGLVHAPASTR